MTGLGVENDNPPDPQQPRLEDGIHLRWQFGAIRGFPWYGYYLFRRPHEEGDPLCVRGRFRSLATNFLGAPFNGAIGSLEHVLPEGTFSSDRPLIVTDDFPPDHFAELDLRDRAFLRYRFAEPARRVQSEIGFRSADLGFTCIRFSQDDPWVAPAPRVVEGARIWTRDFDGSELPESQLRPLGAAFVLNLSAGARIALPGVADDVVLALVSGNRSGGAVARDAAGGIVARSNIPEPQNGVVLIRLQGQGITEVELDLPQNETQLLAMCWHSGDGDSANATDVEIRYFAGLTMIGSETVSGNPGDVVTTSFSADLVTSVEYMRADAALVDVCYVPVRQAVSGRWEPVGDCPPPIALPVRDPQYPANGGLPADQAASRAEALGRIRYGNATDWQGSRFDRLYEALEDLVDLGPAGPAMANVGDDNVPGVPAVPGPQEDTNLNRLRPLNLLMAGALEPQVAQMLGLYCIDTTAVPGQRYDYMIAADHGNVANGSASAMLAHLQNPTSNPLLADAWICFDLSLSTPAPLAQPADLRAYALPGSTRESPDGGLDLLEPERRPALVDPETEHAETGRGRAGALPHPPRVAGRGRAAGPGPGRPARASGRPAPRGDRPEPASRRDRSRARRRLAPLRDALHRRRARRGLVFLSPDRNRHLRPVEPGFRPRRMVAMGAAALCRPRLATAMVPRHQPGRRGGQCPRDFTARQGGPAPAHGGRGVRAGPRRPLPRTRRALPGVVRDAFAAGAAEHHRPARPLALVLRADAPGPRLQGIPALPVAGAGQHMEGPDHQRHGPWCHTVARVHDHSERPGRRGMDRGGAALGRAVVPGGRLGRGRPAGAGCRKPRNGTG